MAVYKDKNGYFVRISKNKNGKRYQKIKRGFKKRSEAVAWEAEYRSQDVTPVTQSFEDVMNAYLAFSEASDTSRYLKSTFVTRHFPLRSEPINKLTKEMLVDWRNALKSSDLATRTANRGMGYIRSVFSYASEVYGIQNVGTVLKSFKLTKADKEEMNNLLVGKVDKVSGKGLSSNDYTDEEKEKLRELPDSEELYNHINQSNFFHQN